MRGARELGREALAVARQGRLIASRRGPRALAGTEADGHAESERVVVFLHGFLAAAPVFDPMRAHVEAALGVPTIDLGYGPFERFERVAARVAGAVDALAARGRRIDLVGHSLGGIVMRWYLQELGGAPRVERLITIASPHAGTRAARIGVIPLAAAIAPGSAVIEALRRGRHRAAEVAHTAIVAGADRMITPPASAAAIEDAAVHWIDDLGHNETLFDRRVFAHVEGALRR